MGASLHVLAAKCDSVENLLTGHLNVLEQYEAFYTRLISEISKLPDEAQNTLAIIQSTVAFHFSSVIEREIGKGTVKNLPIHILFNTWLGLIHYYLLNKKFFADSNQSIIRRYRAELLSAYLHLIKKEGEV